jgi:hypothetical protein
MPKVKLKTKKTVQKRYTKEKADFSLPTELSTPSENFNDYSKLCYGRKKIGKTSLFSKAQNTIFYLFDPGGKAQSIYKLPKKGNCLIDWSEVIGYTKKLAKGGHKFETGIFDGGKPAYELCLKYYCKKNGISHPGEMKDYGASWHGITEEFKRVHLLLASAGMGFVVIAHEDTRTFMNTDGKEYERVTMNFSKKCNEFYEGVIDVICHYGYIGKERWLTIRGDEYIVAGCRIENHFLTPRGEDLFYELQKIDPDTEDEKYLYTANELGKEQIYRIPMGNNPHISHKNLIDAFNNKQGETYKEVGREINQKKKKKRKIKVKKK